MTAAAETETVRLLDDIMVAGLHGGTIFDHVIDQLPPWRAHLYVSVAVGHGRARLQHGTLADLKDATDKCHGVASPGWWSTYLGVSRHPAPAAAM